MTPSARIASIALLLLASIVGITKARIVVAQLTAPPSVTEVLDGGEIPVHGSTLGDPAAPVTIVEFIDLRCGCAGNVHREQLPQVIDELVRPGKAKLSLVALAHPNNRRSAVGQAVFDSVARKGQSWRFTDAVLGTPKGPANTRELDRAYLIPILSRLPGVTPADLMDPALEGIVRKVQRRHERLARRLGATGRPDFAVGWSSASPRTYRLVDGSLPAPTAAEIKHAVEALAPTP